MICFIMIYSLLIGSFLNVCIYRIPRGESIVCPPSHCTNCHHRLSRIELLPITSYLFLKGRCRHCNTSISIRYPVIEAFTCCIITILYIKFGLTLTFFKYAVLMMLLIIVSFIDYDYTIIPDEMIIFGLIAGSLFLFSDVKLSINNALIGMIVGGGIFLIIAIGSHGAVGGGDIKLMAVLGLFLGWKMILFVILASFIIGAAASTILLILKIKSRKDMIPFAPFIGTAAYIAILYGNQMLQWYIENIFIVNGLGW